MNTKKITLIHTSDNMQYECYALTQPIIERMVNGKVFED